MHSFTNFIFIYKQFLVESDFRKCLYKVLVLLQAYITRLFWLYCHPSFAGPSSPSCENEDDQKQPGGELWRGIKVELQEMYLSWDQTVKQAAD